VATAIDGGDGDERRAGQQARPGPSPAERRSTAAGTQRCDRMMALAQWRKTSSTSRTRPPSPAPSRPLTRSVLAVAGGERQQGSWAADRAVDGVALRGSSSHPGESYWLIGALMSPSSRSRWSAASGTSECFAQRVPWRRRLATREMIQPKTAPATPPVAAPSKIASPALSSATSRSVRSGSGPAATASSCRYWCEVGARWSVGGLPDDRGREDCRVSGSYGEPSWDS
jgi:hypothetical protein